MNKKTIIKTFSILITIIIVINLGIFTAGQIALPHSKNPYERTIPISTIAFPYLHHGKPDAIDESLVEMTGEKIWIYENKKVNGKNCDIRYTITEDNTLHEVAYYFDVCQKNYLDSKLPKQFERTNYEDKVEFDLNTSLGGEYITCFDNGTVFVEYFY